MTHAGQAVSMKDARVLETEVLVPRPKRFVRELGMGTHRRGEKAVAAAS